MDLSVSNIEQAATIRLDDHERSFTGPAVVPGGFLEWKGVQFQRLSQLALLEPALAKVNVKRNAVEVVPDEGGVRGPSRSGFEV